MAEQELKTLDIGGIFDKTFKLVFDNFKNWLRILSIYCLVILPLMIFPNLPYFRKYNIFFSIVNFLISIVFDGILIDLFIKSFLNEEWVLNKSFLLVRTKFMALILAILLSYLIIFGGILLLVIGALVFAVFISLIQPCIIYENHRTLSAVSRSFKLVSYNFWHITLTFILYFLMILGLLLCFGIVVLIIFAFVFFAVDRNIIESIKDLSNLKNITLTNMNSGLIIALAVLMLFYFIFIMLVHALSSALTVVLFFNQKIKNENFGIELLADTISSGTLEAENDPSVNTGIENSVSNETKAETETTDPENKDDNK